MRSVPFFAGLEFEFEFEFGKGEECNKCPCAILHGGSGLEAAARVWWNVTTCGLRRDRDLGSSFAASLGLGYAAQEEPGGAGVRFGPEVGWFSKSCTYVRTYVLR